MTDDMEGRKAARAVAEYELGDSSWADMIISAYLFPDRALRILAAEQEDEL